MRDYYVWMRNTKVEIFIKLIYTRLKTIAKCLFHHKSSKINTPIISPHTHTHTNKSNFLCIFRRILTENWRLRHQCRLAQRHRNFAFENKRVGRGEGKTAEHLREHSLHIVRHTVGPLRVVALQILRILVHLRALFGGRRPTCTILRYNTILKKMELFSSKCLLFCEC